MFFADGEVAGLYFVNITIMEWVRLEGLNIQPSTLEQSVNAMAVTSMGRI